MSYMFYGYNSLKELNIRNFNTNKVKDTTCMFYECSSLKTLYFSQFNAYNISNMSFMFFCCSSLIIVDSFNFSFDLLFF